MDRFYSLLLCRSPAFSLASRSAWLLSISLDMLEANRADGASRALIYLTDEWTDGHLSVCVCVVLCRVVIHMLYCEYQKHSSVLSSFL